MKVYTEEERKLHHYIIHQRNKLYAHSDAELYNVGLISGKSDRPVATPYIESPFKEFEKQDLENVVQMILKLSEAIRKMLETMVSIQKAGRN